MTSTVINPFRKDIFNLDNDFEYLNVDNLNVQSANIVDLVATNGTVTDGKITTLSATDGTISTLSCGVMSSTTINGTTSNITTMNATTSNITTMNATTSNITTMNATTSVITNATATNLSSTNASFYLATVSSTLDSNAKTEGALIVSGGMGVAKTLVSNEFKNILAGSAEPAGNIFWAPLSSNPNATYSGGAITGTLGGNAVIQGGKLDVSFSGTKDYVAYDITSKITVTNVFAFRFKYTPNYSGAPSPKGTTLFQFNSGVVGSYWNTPKNNVRSFHDINGTIGLQFTNNSSQWIMNPATIYSLAWLPTAGTEYEFEYNINCNEKARLFINGILMIESPQLTPSRGTMTTLVFGGNATDNEVPAVLTNGKFRYFSFFDTIQHTANYTPAVIGSWITTMNTSGISISNTADATSSTSGGTITTSGGLAVAKKCYFGDTLNVTGISTFSNTTEASDSKTGGTIISGGLAVAKKCYFGDILNVTGISTFSNTTDASDSKTGGTIISGGLAVAKKCYVGTDLNVAGIANLTNTTDATSSTAGGVIISGGLATAKKCYVGTDLNVAGNIIVGTSSNISNASYTYTLPAKTGTLACLSDISIANMVTTDTKQTITGEKTFQNVVTITSDTVSLRLKPTGTYSSSAVKFYDKDGNQKSTLTYDTMYSNISMYNNTCSQGLGVSDTLGSYASGTFRVQGTTDSTDTKTGSAIVSGGLAVAKKINVGSEISSTSMITKNDTLGGGTLHYILANTAGVARWKLGMWGTDSGTGTGSAGSTLAFWSYNDDGSYYNNPISVTRDGNASLKSVYLATVGVGASASPLNYYEEFASGNVSFTGACAITASFKVVRTGKQCVLTFDSYLYNGNASSASTLSCPAGTIPARLCPPNNIYETARIQSGGTNASGGAIIIQTDGSIAIYAVNYAVFASSGQAGWWNRGICWNVA